MEPPKKIRMPHGTRAVSFHVSVKLHMPLSSGMRNSASAPAMAMVASFRRMPRSAFTASPKIHRPATQANTSATIFSPRETVPSLAYDCAMVPRKSDTSVLRRTKRQLSTHQVNVSSVSSSGTPKIIQSDRLKLMS